MARRRRRDLVSAPALPVSGARGAVDQRGFLPPPDTLPLEPPDEWPLLAGGELDGRLPNDGAEVVRDGCADGAEARGWLTTGAGAAGAGLLVRDAP
jgi:hypothetical protein